MLPYNKINVVLFPAMGVCAITKQKMLDKYEALGFNKYFIIIGVLGWW